MTEVNEEEVVRILMMSSQNLKRSREAQQKLQQIDQGTQVNNEQEKQIQRGRKPLKVDRDWLVYELLQAFFDARKGKLRTMDEFNFEFGLMWNIEALADDIIYRRYKPSRGVVFIVNRPVKREIFAAPFRDRVVHHFLYNMVYGWWDARLSPRSFSCRVGRGTLYGIKALQRDMRRASRGGRERAYVLKFDLKGYFMSLPHEKIYERALRGLKQQFPKGGQKFNIAKFLWREVIFDDPVDGVRIRPGAEEWADLSMDKSLICQPENLGMVIGNLSSQLLSNIYLDLLDRYVTRRLGYKYYGRYVDDFYIVVPEAQYQRALSNVADIRRFLQGLGLRLHPNKFYIQEVSHGAEFLGMVVYIDHRRPTKRFKHNYYVAAKAFGEGMGKAESIISYVGYSKHMNAWKFSQKMLALAGF